MGALLPPTSAFRALSYPSSCIFCQNGFMVRSVRRMQSSSKQVQQQQTKAAQHPSPPAQTSKPGPTRIGPIIPRRTTNIPRSPTADRPHIRARDGELVPQPLARPLGLPHPPQSGQNTGIDTRSWKERRDDFASYDKHLDRRRTLIKDLYEKNYFRDIGNVGVIHKGKSMLAPATPFRREVAMYFPNLRGRTLEAKERDTTDVLKGKVTIVKMIGTSWADIQCESFVGKVENPELWEVLGQEEATAQLVDIQVETNWLKWALVRTFTGRLKKLKGMKQWGRYFLVRRGVDDDIKEALGIWNSTVGYVYLLDAQCKIRWASNGDARDDEKKSLVNCLRRLIAEAKGVSKPKITRQEPKSTATARIVEEPSAGPSEQNTVTASS